MNRASPHRQQPHSGQSPSATSGQLAGSACNCSNGRSSPHSVQYLVSWLIPATSSVRCNTNVQRINRGCRDSDMLAGQFVGSAAACLQMVTTLWHETIADVQPDDPRRAAV